MSGNRSDGIRIDERATGNDLQGNLIGTTFTGRAPLPNDDDGVTINNSSENTIGGTQPGAGNVISANAGDGVSLEGFDVVEANRVLGNWIGTNKTAQRDLGNGGSGVHIGFGDDNTVGDDDETSPLNTIMHNGDDGVTIENGFGNSVLRNSMADNGNLAIDLGGDGSTANDPNDLDFGSNGLQNGPEIEEATTTTVEWELETTPSTRSTGSSSTPATARERARARHTSAPPRRSPTPTATPTTPRRCRPPSKPATTWR